MATLIADGFDFYNAVTDLTLTGSPWASASGVPTTTTPYSVGKSFQVGAGNTLASVSLSNEATIYFAFALYTTSSFTGSATTGHQITLIETAGNQVFLHWALDGNFYVRTASFGGTILGTWAHGMAPSTWTHFQVKVVINNTTGSVEIRKNNNPSNDYTVTNINTRNGTTNAYANKLSITSTTATFLVDDIFVSSASGVAPTSWPGQLRAVQLMPTADTAQKDLTPNAGTTNYTQVNEAVFNGDTTYVFGSTAGLTDLYALQDLATTPTSIPLVVAKIIVKKSDTGARTATTRVNSGGTLQDQATITLATTYQWQNTYLATDPSTTSAWTAAGVNALQLGGKVVA